MDFVSTTDVSDKLSFREAALSGLSQDGGLYIPERIPKVSYDFKAAQSAKELTQLFLAPFCDLQNEVLQRLLTRAHNFHTPLEEINISALSNPIYIQELFHGPTLAFKDFGARFMAVLFEHFLEFQEREIRVLVATSGDTGGAVANAFKGVKGVRVYILYPKNNVSSLQEKQLTTAGDNVKALAVNATFDDCQALVKRALKDLELTKKFTLVSANSINIARLLPQAAYYLSAVWQLSRAGYKEPPIFVVPSGNLGNLTAGIIAKLTGMPCRGFLAANNSNNVFSEFVNGKAFTSRPSISTLSNAMDVGNPSNFARLSAILGTSIEQINKTLGNDCSLIASWINEQETQQAISYHQQKNNYLVCPHTAVGLAALQKLKNSHTLFRTNDSCPIVVLGTAHPAKFPEVYEGIKPTHESLEKLKNMSSRVQIIENDFSSLKGIVLS